MNKSLSNANSLCGCSVLCLRPKSSVCSCPYGPPYGRIVVFSLSLTVETSCTHISVRYLSLLGQL